MNDAERLEYIDWLKAETARVCAGLDATTKPKGKKDG